jgi:serine/threonine protein kinase
MRVDRMTSDPFRIVGRIVDGRYRVERVAGEGGYGVVYQARHLGFDSPIALKVLKLPESWSLERKQARVASFQREGRMLFELSALHPAIVRAFETGTLGAPDGSPAPYLALEWLDGVSLEHEAKMRRKRAITPMTLPEVLGLLNGPAEGLARAHARGVVHRDVKPGNLFVSMQNGHLSVKILDFGVAKIVDEAADTSAQYAATAGATASFTAMYAAPEQWLERLGATGTWTDVHALALVCVELLSGTIPFAGRESAQFMAACLDPVLRPTPKSRGVELAAEVEAVFARAVALEPRERIRDVGSFWQELSAAARWSPERSGTRVELVALQTKADAVDAPADSRASRGGDAALSSRASTTAATASLASRRTPDSRRPSFSRWPAVAAIVVAGTSLGGYLVTSVGRTNESEKTVLSPPPSLDSRVVLPSEVSAHRLELTADATPGSMPAAPAPSAAASMSPAPAGRDAARAPAKIVAARPHALSVPPPAFTSNDAFTMDTRTLPAPARSAEPLPPEPPSQEPSDGPNYDDPALTHRK